MIKLLVFRTTFQQVPEDIRKKIVQNADILLKECVSRKYVLSLFFSELKSDSEEITTRRNHLSKKCIFFSKQRVTR